MPGKIAKLGLLTTLFVSVIGCGPSGPPMGKVAGTVTYRGGPLPTGTITFVPLQGDFGAPIAEIRQDGTYEATTPDLGKGLPVGQYRVMITAMKDNGPEAAATELLPPKYGSDEQSGLTAEVTEGDNTIDFALK